MKFQITIDMDNDAFAQSPETEIVRILQDVRERIETGDADSLAKMRLRDMNGNNVGEAKFTE